jgi:hypothetical protein
VPHLHPEGLVLVPTLVPIRYRTLIFRGGKPLTKSISTERDHHTTARVFSITYGEIPEKKRANMEK